MSKTVWAFRGGQRWKPANGWNHCINFWTLSTLMSQMDKKNIKGKVTKLGILVHGDVGGLVKLDRNMTLNTLPSFESDLKKLYQYFPGYGKLIFFGCLTGLGNRGDAFLCALSKILPQIQVIAFTEKNWVPGSAGGDGKLRAGDCAPTPAGTVYKAGHIGHADPAKYRGKPLLTEYDSIAKWSAVGWIVRPALREVRNLQTYSDRQGNPVNPHKFCGSFNCLGHEAIGDWCENYRRKAGTMKNAEASWRLIHNSYGGEDYRIMLKNGKVALPEKGVNTRSTRQSRPEGLGSSRRKARTPGL